MSPTATPAAGSQTRSGRAANIAAWILQVLGAAAFLAAGVSKLAGAPMMVQAFEQIGVGQWFRIVTGLVEVSGAILLLVPGLAAFGGLLLATTMVFAVLTHLVVIGGNPVPAIVLFLVTATVAWLRRGQFAALIARR